MSGKNTIFWFKFFKHDFTIGSVVLLLLILSLLAYADDVVVENGNLGIGTGSPAYNLHIYNTGTIRQYLESADNGAVHLGLKSDSANNRRIMVRNSANTVNSQIGFEGDSVVFAGPDYINNQVMRINLSNGNIGMGTSSPNYNLDIEDSDSTAYINLVSSSTDLTGILMGDTGSEALSRIIHNNSDNSLYFSTLLKKRMTIDSSGNVGIGTANPDSASKLHVVGASGDDIHIESSDVDGQVGVRLENDARIWRLRVRGANNDAFEIRDVTAGLDRLTIDTSGNVGIGNTNPSYKLDVASTTTGSKQILSQVAIDGAFGAGNEAAIQFLTSENSSGVPQPFLGNTARISGIVDNTGSGSYGTALAFYTQNQNIAGNAVIEYMRITSGGKVGIGTSNPGNILTVQQTSPTDPIADAWTTYSSQRWKENIRPIDDALEKVGRLQGVYFDWNANGKHDLGMIAEEVGKVVPEVVVYEENGVDAKSVDYGRLTSVLVEAIKQQQAEINELRLEVKSLKAKTMPIYELAQSCRPLHAVETS